MSIHSCRISGYYHDWRHLSTRHHRTDENVFHTYDTWYCTRCRKVEEIEREPEEASA